MPENMPISSGKVCLICGYEDCETVQQRFTESRHCDDEQSARISRVDQSERIQQAANLLAASKSTLICGLDNVDLNAQMAAWKLADQSRAIIDISLSHRSHASIQSLQRHGKVSATYGEIASRSDLIVIWDCDLQPKHPCLLRMLTSDQVKNRKVVFVGRSDSPMAKLANQVYHLDTTNDRHPMIRLVCRLRAKVAGRTLHHDQFDERDLPADKVEELIGLLTNANYGSLLFAPGEDDWEFDLETESLLQFVNELNSITPLVCMGIRDDANGLGAENILTLASGFPMAINLQRGLATSAGSVYNAPEVLRRSACDVILLCGNANQNGSNAVPDWLHTELVKVTVIQLAPQPEEFTDLFIACPTISPGHAFTGNVFRGDGMVLSGATPDVDHSAELILQSILAAYRATSVSKN